MNNANCQIIILAAGKGSRMNSALPKVMHRVAGKSMLEHVLSNATEITNDIILVHSIELLPYLADIKSAFIPLLQEVPQGTAHAAFIALKALRKDKISLILYGDNPFINAKVIQKLLVHLESTKSMLATLCFRCEDFNEYGRIVCDAQGNFDKIVEHKDASLAEKKITLCNSGVMAFAPGILENYLPICMQKTKEIAEFYLTNIVEICKKHGEKVSYLLHENANVVIGVNTQEELKYANLIAGSEVE